MFLACDIGISTTNSTLTYFRLEKTTIEKKVNASSLRDLKLSISVELFGSHLCTIKVVNSQQLSDILVNASEIPFQSNSTALSNYKLQSISFTWKDNRCMCQKCF